MLEIYGFWRNTYQNVQNLKLYPIYVCNKATLLFNFMSDHFMEKVNVNQSDIDREQIQLKDKSLMNLFFYNINIM